MAVSSSKIFKVAVLSNLDNHFHRTIGVSLSKQSGEMSDNSFFKVALLNAAFTEEAVTARLIWCREQRIDFIVVVGAFFSVAVHKLMPSIGHIPYIFVGVRDPIKMGLVDTLTGSTSGITGIIRTPADSLHIARCLSLLQPYVSTVLLPYYPQGLCGQLGEQAIKIEHYFATRGIKTTLWPLRTLDELKTELAERVAAVDTLLFLEGCQVSCYMPEAARLCWDVDKIFCYGESSDAIRYGAACSYGSKFAGFITTTLKILDDYFNQGIALGKMPVTVLEDDRYFNVNEAMLLQVGVSDEVINQLRQRDKSERIIVNRTFIKGLDR